MVFMVFGNLFKRRQPDLAALEKLDLPELPQLPALEKKKKGRKVKSVPSVPAYLSYISVDKHDSDIKRVTTLIMDMQRQTAATERSLKDVQHQLAEMPDIRKEIDGLKKVKFAGIQDLRKDIESMRKIREEMDMLRKELGEKPKAVEQLSRDIAELQTVWDEIEAIRSDIQGKKGTKDLSRQLAKLESDVQLMQKQLKNVSTEEMKAELQRHIKSLVVQHVFESKYDPKQLKSMKNDVLSFISKAIEAGESEDKVKTALIARGWPEQLVEAYYDNVYDEKIKQ